VKRCFNTVSVSSSSVTRRRSSPSSNADNCAADKCITPSSILGQRKMPSSSRLANRQSPVPSQKISLIRSARLARNTYIAPENGSTLMASRTRVASPLGALF
jgi:hypothetical protein